MNNPAARLAHVLRQVRGHRDGEATNVVFKSVLGSRDDAELARDFANLLSLPDLVVSSVSEAADPEHEDLDWLFQWRPAVTNALNQAWAFTSAIQGVKQQYSGEHLVHLEACGVLLSRAKFEPRIDPSTIESLREQTQALHEELLQADSLPADLRSFMLDHLDRILRALREFALRGAAALRDAVDQTVGAYVTTGMVLRERTSDPNTRSWVERFKSVLAAVGAVTTVATGMLALPAAAEEAINVLTSTEDTTSQPTVIVKEWTVGIDESSSDTGESVSG
nr:hypothetical protein [Prescottella equi]